MARLDVEKLPVSPTIILSRQYLERSVELPQYLLEAGWAADGRVIACTQPRRVAATSVAARVSNEVGTKLGDEVGGKAKSKPC